MSAHHEQRIYRTAWTGFPDVIVQTTVNKLRSLPSYESAKRGNGEAAFEVISQLLKPDKISFEFDTVVPVAQFDRTYPNALPFAYAIQLAKHFEADLSLDIVQSNALGTFGHTLPEFDSFWPFLKCRPYSSLANCRAQRRAQQFNSPDHTETDWTPLTGNLGSHIHSVHVTRHGQLPISCVRPQRHSRMGDYGPRDFSGVRVIH